MKVYMVRHGETLWNRREKIQGQVNVPLTDRGREQARQTGAKLKDIPFDIGYTSPLGRARETMKIIKGGRDFPVHIDERLLEVGFGNREGQSLILIRRLPFMKLYPFYHDPEHYIPPEGAESFQNLENRCAGFLNDTVPALEREGFQNVLATAHGALIGGMIHHVKGAPLKDFWKTYDQGYCAVTIFECVNGMVRILQEGKVLY